MSSFEYEIAVKKNVLGRIGKSGTRGLMTGLTVEGQATMTDAIEHTPLETGALRGSGMAHPAEVSGDKITVRLTFGGAAAPYALFVHEIMGRNHPVGEAKFLENAVTRRADGIATRLAAYVTKSIQQDWSVS